MSSLISSEQTFYFSEGLDHKRSGFKCLSSKYVMLIKQICRLHLFLLSTLGCSFLFYLTIQSLKSYYSVTACLQGWL